MKLFTFLLSGLFLMLQAQPVSVGVKGGFVLTDATRFSNDESRNYTVGPTVEFRLPRNFAIETGFLYKRIGTSSAYQFDGTQAFYRTRGNSFEIPVVGKYYVRSSRVFTPYLGLGVAMRRARQTTRSSIIGPGTSLIPIGSSRSEDVSAFGAGAVGAAGVQFQHGRWKISPEFRYTRWSREIQRIPRNPNQVEFLMGVSF
jgi:opacity protein-like surface antigen